MYSIANFTEMNRIVYLSVLEMAESRHFVAVEHLRPISTGGIMYLLLHVSELLLSKRLLPSTLPLTNAEWHCVHASFEILKI